MPDKKTVNIMTSCDDNLAIYIMPQLASIAVNLKGHNVNFFLFHSAINPETIEKLRLYAQSFGNINFNEIKITDTAPYEAIASRGGQWPYEAYYSLCCHEYLPEDVDRVLYIDAGDIVIHGDISPYYFSDFGYASLITTLTGLTMDEETIRGRFNDNNIHGLLSMASKIISRENIDFSAAKELLRPFNREDLSDEYNLKIILKQGVFNSGCYVINVSRFREDGRAIGDYLYLYNVLRERFPDDEMLYYGDQGFISAAFVGDIKYYGYPDNRNLGYSPYNFGIWFYERREELGYTPAVIHYAGINYIKPWKARFSLEEINKYKFDDDPNVIHVPFRLNAKQAGLYEVWWKYCEMTPIYGRLNETARAAAKALEENYLPLCQWYNELADKYLAATGEKPPDLIKLKIKDQDKKLHG